MECVTPTETLESSYHSVWGHTMWPMWQQILELLEKCHPGVWSWRRDPIVGKRKCLHFPGNRGKKIWKKGYHLNVYIFLAKRHLQNHLVKSPHLKKKVKIQTKRRLITCPRPQRLLGVITYVSFPQPSDFLPTSH